MIEIKPTAGQTEQQLIEMYKSRGLYVTEKIVNGKTVKVALELDEMMLHLGIKSLEGQDETLAKYMTKMEEGNKKLQDINNGMQDMNNAKNLRETGKKTLSDKEITAAEAYRQYAEAWMQQVTEAVNKLPGSLEDLQKLLEGVKNSGNSAHAPYATTLLECVDAYKRWGGYGGGPSNIARDLAKGDLDNAFNAFISHFKAACVPVANPIDANGANNLWTASWLSEVVQKGDVGGFENLTLKAGAIQKLDKTPDVWDMLTGNLYKALQTGMLPAQLQAKIKALIDADLLPKDTKYTGALTPAEFEALQKNLSAAQSNQGTVNETISLNLNEASSKRQSVFTQLQTLLQTIEQAKQGLARW
jgi:hypothetical protein